MKQIINLRLLTVLFCILSVQAFSQAGLYIASGSNFFINSGTIVSVDGLVLTPSVNYNILGTNAVTRDATATPPPPTNYIQRVYHLLQTLPAYSGDITIYYQDAELNGIAEAALNLDVYNGSTWNIYSPTVRDATNNFVSTTGLTNINLKQLTLATLTAVPVALSSFNVRNDNCIAMLNWTTATEQNSKHFEVQLSTDGINFNTVGIVPSNGNSNIERHYNFSSNLVNPNNYFRLQMVDIDGSTKSGPIVMVTSTCTNRVITMYPNPSRNTVTVRGLTGDSRLFLLDNLGQVIKSIKTSNYSETLDIATLPAGAYLLQVLHNNKVIDNIKVVKE
jgi:hypothetical protein